MGSNFEGFEKYWTMSLNAQCPEGLLKLKNLYEHRRQIDLKLLEGILSKKEIVDLIQYEFVLLNSLLESMELKMEANKPYTSNVMVITLLTKRINRLWNNVYLLFFVNQKITSDFITIKPNEFKTDDPKKIEFNRIKKGIINNIEVHSTKRNSIYMLTGPDFANIIETIAFVDKTLMIKEVLRNKDIKGTVITTPTKFGKSTNLTMLKYFFELQVDSFGNPLTKAKTGKPVTDTSNYHLFKGLKIIKEAEIMEEHFGKYPVLYVDFKMEDCVKSYSCAVYGFQQSVHKSFKLHEYLLNSPKLTNDQKKTCELWCDDKSYLTRNFFEIITGLQSLCAFLNTHYMKPCFVLIDNVDSLTLSGTITAPIYNDFKLILYFMNYTLHFLKYDSVVFRSFLTGKYVYYIHNIIPSCIQIKMFSEFHEFTDYFGLTLNELEYLYKKPVFKSLKSTIEKVKVFYGAYYKIDRVTKRKKEIYCIWSVLNVLLRDRIDNFWRDFGNIFFNFLNPWINNKIQQLIIQENHIMIRIYDTKQERHYEPPPTLETHSKRATDYFFNILLDLGYITCAPNSIHLAGFNNIKNSSVIYIKIPNPEITQDIENKLSILC